MELFCHERADLNSSSPVKSAPIRAFRDAVLTRDTRVLQNLLSLEKPNISGKHIAGAESEELLRMRKILTGWMLQVCEEQKCEEEVFPLAVHYLDRYMSQSAVRRCHLQLLGSVCMFLASKLRETVPLSAETLSIYTDHACSVSEILQWEVLLVSHLQWDLASVLPSDFLELILQALPIPAQDHSSVRRHTHCYIALTATELKFSFFRPSVVACSCVTAALLRLKLLQDTVSAEQMLQMLSNMLDMDKASLHVCFSALEEMIEQTLPAPPVQMQDVPL